MCTWGTSLETCPLEVLELLPPDIRDGLGHSSNHTVHWKILAGFIEESGKGVEFRTLFCTPLKPLIELTFLGDLGPREIQILTEAAQHHPSPLLKVRAPLQWVNENIEAYNYFYCQTLL